MPIWLRNLTFNLLKEHYDKQNEAAEKQQNSLAVPNKKKEIARPGISEKKPTYVAKSNKQ